MKHEKYGQYDKCTGVYPLYYRVQVNTLEDPNKLVFEFENNNAEILLNCVYSWS